jgi:hypothetical protein
MPNKTIIYAFIAMWLYALQNVVLEVRLAKYSTIGLLVCWYFTLAPLGLAALAWLRYTGQPLTLPARADLGMVVAAGALFFVADLFYIGAYTGSHASGGGLLAITTMLVLFPAIAQIIKFAWVGGRMNWWHAAGYLLAAVAVLLISKGSSLQEG